MSHADAPVPLAEIAERYRAFATEQAAGSSPTMDAWARAVADDPGMLATIATLPFGKQQPNLVLAAARRNGAVPGDADSLRERLATDWEEIRTTILTHATQTNEAARCAAIVLGLQKIDGPIALLEVGASAGLCLLPDAYSYRFSDGTRLDPDDGPSPVTIDVAVEGPLPYPLRMPTITWRRGLDLHPLDPADPDTLAWLETLVWPEHEERRARLAAAGRLASQRGLEIREGNLLHDLAALAAEAPKDATLVVTHLATLAYLGEEERHEAVDVIAATGARRLAYEGRGVDPAVPALGAPTTPETLFVAALDGVPYALGSGHGDRLTPLARPRD